MSGRRKTIWLSIALAAGFLLTGCVTERRCNQKYPPQESTLVHETDSHSVKDSTYRVPYFVYLRGETVTVDVPVPCPEADISKTDRKNHLISTLTVKNGVARCDCHEDSIKAAMEKEIRLRTEKSVKTKIVYKKRVKKIVEYRTPWYMWLLIILMAVERVFGLFNRIKIPFIK